MYSSLLRSYARIIEKHGECEVECFGDFAFRKITFLEKEYIDFGEACLSLGLDAEKQVAMVKDSSLCGHYARAWGMHLIAVNRAPIWLLQLDLDEVSEENRATLDEYHSEVFAVLSQPHVARKAFVLAGQPYYPRMVVVEDDGDEDDGDEDGPF